MPNWPVADCEIDLFTSKIFYEISSIEFGLMISKPLRHFTIGGCR